VVLTEVTTQGDSAHARILARKSLDDAPRFVGSAVLDQDDLEAGDQRFEGGNQPAVQLVQEGCPTVHGHDDREIYAFGRNDDVSRMGSWIVHGDSGPPCARRARLPHSAKSKRAVAGAGSLEFEITYRVNNPP